MKFAWKHGEARPFDRYIEFCIEPSGNGFWCYYKGRREAGNLENPSLHGLLKWILDQIKFGHFALVFDEDKKATSVLVGKKAPIQAANHEEAANEAGEIHLISVIAKNVAEAKEKGSQPKFTALEKKCWDATAGGSSKIELAYAYELVDLLGRITKKIRKLEILPIVGTAPETTRKYLAEATRCYLLKLDRACIAICRACLEDTLKENLTDEMKDQWMQEMDKNKRVFRNPNPMKALIDVCSRQGILGKFTKDAHFIREEGNNILHLNEEESDKTRDLPGEVLQKTRGIIRMIYGEEASEPGPLKKS